MKNPKSEVRSPKETRISKVERSTRSCAHNSDFRFRFSYGFRISSFGFIALRLSVIGFQFSAFSQSYSIDWHKIAGGGGTSTSGVYQVSGTIGQPDAGSTMSGGNFSLSGGFWSLLTVVQTPGAPTLTIQRGSPGNAIIAWNPITPGFVLQETTALSPVNWTNSISGVTNPVTVPANIRKFYRLIKSN